MLYMLCICYSCYNIKILSHTLVKNSQFQAEKTKSEPKLVKCLNEFKKILSREPKSNPTRTEIFRVHKCMQNIFMYLNILVILDLNIKKISNIYKMY